MIKTDKWIWLIVILGLVPSAWLISKGLKRKPAGEYISVVGMAEVDFTSDLIVWSSSYSRTSFQLQDAYRALKADKSKVIGFLKEKGLNDSEIIYGTINIEKLYDYRYENGSSQSIFQGYKVSQPVTVKSGRVTLVESVSRESMSLIEKEIEFNSNNPEFYYTKLSNLKLNLIEKATKDARLRAEKIAVAAGAALGSLKKSGLGVFQITGQYENEEYSYGGVFNTSSKLKTARVTVSCSYKPE
jgi:uncharacterized protein